MRRKKYIIFQWDDHEAAGGLNDVTGSCDTVAECYEQIGKNIKHNNQIADRDTWEIVDADAVEHTTYECNGRTYADAKPKHRF